MKHKYSYINWRDTSYKTCMASCLEKMCAGHQIETGYATAQV